jgi:hypothetical protein
MSEQGEVDRLMSVPEFNARVKQWATIVKDKARKTLASTHATGTLSAQLEDFVDSLTKDDPAYKIKFSFLRYGVYRQYGAGRGYVIVNGVPVRGYRVRSNKEIANKIMSAEGGEMMKRGYSMHDVNTAKMVRKGNLDIQRTALDWLDGHIKAGVNSLAELVGEFYGDAAAASIYKQIKKAKIVKIS